MSIHESERLSAYVDGELDELERARLERELLSDPTLRASVASLRALRDHVQQVGPVRAPSGLYNRIMEDIDDAQHRAQRQTWWRRPLGFRIEQLALAALTLLVLYAALPSTEDSSPAVTLEVGPAVRLQEPQDTPANPASLNWQLVIPAGVQLTDLQRLIEVADGRLSRSLVVSDVGGVPGDVAVTLDATALGELEAALQTLGVRVIAQGEVPGGGEEVTIPLSLRSGDAADAMD